MSGTLYPGGLDDNTSLPNPGTTDSTDSSNALLKHNYQHDTVNDALKAIEAKLGTTASVPGASGQILTATGGGGSTWQNPGAAGAAGGDLVGNYPSPSLSATGVVSGTYGSSTRVPILVIDAKGRITSASTAAVSGGGGGGITSPLTTKGDIWGFDLADNRIPVGSNGQILTADSTQTLGLKWASPATNGTVTTLSVVSNNGFAGSVANPGTTPAITISTTVTGILKGNGTGMSAAASGTDYAPGTSGLGTGIVKSTTGTGVLSIAVAADFPTLNQSTTGNAGTVGGYTAADLTPLGVMHQYAGRAAPSANWLMCDGGNISRTTYAGLFAVLVPSVGTFTVTVAAPAVVSLTGHAFQTGDSLYLTTTGALPTGLTANTIYYAVRIDANSFNLATSVANAYAGTKITTTGTQSGTHTCLACPYGLGDGSTTFSLPDLRGRVPAGNDAMNGTAASRLTNPSTTSGGTYGNPGASGGEQAHVQTSSELATHAHNIRTADNSYTIALAGTSGTGGQGMGRNSGATDVIIAQNAGSSTAANVVQPTLVTNYIIKAL